MNSKREKFVEEIKNGYVERILEEQEIERGNKSISLTEEIIEQEVKQYSNLLKSNIIEKSVNKGEVR